MTMCAMVCNTTYSSSKVKNDVLNKVNSSENKNFIMQNEKLNMENKSLKINH